MLNIVTAAFYLFVCAITAAVAAGGYSSRIPGKDGVEVPLAWWLVFFGCFFAGFYILGCVNVLTDSSPVTPGYALGIATVGFMIPALVMSRRQSRLLRVREYAAPVPRLNLQDLSRLSRVLLFVTLAVFGAIALMLSAGFPRGYEPLAYHLPIALHIFQDQTLRVWDTAFMHSFPANASIYSGFLLILIPERLVSASNMVFLIPLGMAVYGLGRALGADKDAAVISALGMLTIPVVAFSAFEGGADLGGMAFLAMAVYFVIARPDSGRVSLILAGVAAGIAFGFKSLHLVSIVFLTLLIVIQGYSTAVQAGNRYDISRALVPALIFLLGVMFAAGFWLFRNYLELGNPLYPVHLPVIFDLLGWAKAPDIDYSQRAETQFEWVRSPAEWWLYPWVEWHYISQNFKHSSGLGAFFAATVPVALLIALLSLCKAGVKEKGRLLPLLAGGWAVVLMWWVLGDRQPRYLMGSLVFWLPLAAWLISQTRGRVRRVYHWIGALTILPMLVIIFSKQAVEFADRIILSKQLTRHEFYEYPTQLDRLDAGSTVINLIGRPWNYPLLGERHENRLVNFMKALRALHAESRGDDPPESALLGYPALRQMQATHVMASSTTKLELDDCVELKEIGKLDRNPVNKKPLPGARILYEIVYCESRRGPDAFKARK